MTKTISRKGVMLLTLLSMLLSAQLFACSEDGNSGFVEENDLYVGLDEKNSSDMTEEKFNEIIDKVINIYEPVVKAMGATLTVDRKWEDGTVNAYAKQSGKIWNIAMFGGLARHETITADAFAMVVCHELGHHIGGAPKKKSWFGGSRWASNEGQSDYFATLKCFRKVFETDDNVAIITAMNDVDAVATKNCKAKFTLANDVALCQRSSMGGLSLADLFKVLRKLTTPLKFDTPDSNEVKKTDHNHPAPQCRLDTYFAGSICEKAHADDVSDKDANVATCNREAGHKIGIRPLCWFKP